MEAGRAKHYPNSCRNNLAGKLCIPARAISRRGAGVDSSTALGGSRWDSAACRALYARQVETDHTHLNHTAQPSSAAHAP